MLYLIHISREGGFIMQILSVKEMAMKWNVSERTIRNYCQMGKIPGAYLKGKTWNIPENAQIPSRKNAIIPILSPLVIRIVEEKKDKMPGGIYHKVQIELTYNSNHMEGSKLTHDQTRYIYETNTIGPDKKSINVDDIVETVNHFRCIDYIIDHYGECITEKMVKELHSLLKNGTSDSRKSWFAVGEYKKLPNEVAGIETTAPENVSSEMQALLQEFKSNSSCNLEDLLEFHYRFERIHPFQDGNGRIGRLLLLKECLRYHIVPFIITDELKMFYYRGLSEWTTEKGYLLDTCFTAQDVFKQYLDYFRIEYEK